MSGYEKTIEVLDRERLYVRSMADNYFNPKCRPSPEKRDAFEKVRCDVYAAMNALDQAAFLLKRADRVTEEEL